ncbi:hypothetical protein HID58_029041, partial [Brassica napus]
NPASEWRPEITSSRVQQVGFSQSSASSSSLSEKLQSECKSKYFENSERKSEVAGVAWIVRDSEGESLLHSRKSFVRVKTLEEAKEKALVWTLECMVEHRLDNLIIAGEDAVLLKVIERPRAWPSLTSVVHKLENFLCRFGCWKSKVKTRSSNRCAYLIADSASKSRWFQSYVARGAPFWISSIVAFE